MSVLQTTKAKASSVTANGSRLFFLELSGGRIHSMRPDGSDRKIIVDDCRLPDGIAVDARAGHIYWTNMGVPNIERRLDRARRPRRRESQESSCHKASRTRRSRSTSIRTTASSIGATARACA